MMIMIFRRLSSSVDSPEVNLLCVPVQPMTASSSAETLTDNTLTAPSTPTMMTQRLVVQDSIEKDQEKLLVSFKYFWNPWNHAGCPTSY